MGLSPRVRGNRRRGMVAFRRHRSIPARAGEPTRAATRTTKYPVYPRACGGTRSLRASMRARRGLSPRVRGNPPDCRPRRWCRGSIPARAGEPISLNRSVSLCRVYPRACGGTIRRWHGYSSVPGLSPRVRGNPPDCRPRRWCRGSIPARAGEPQAGRGVADDSGVYPRACGGTRFRYRRHLLHSGLSPRVRGNPPDPDVVGGQHRSIPARAGEPLHRLQSPAALRVYPRACGGTSAPMIWASSFSGLSPRVRGNRL